MSDSFDLNISGKSALVTGASSGLGLQFAKVLAQAGVKVVACARRAERLEQLVRDVNKGEIHGVVMDVTDVNSVIEAFDRAEELVGTPEIIVNNAGIALPARVLEMSDDDWRATIDTNLNGVYWCAREAGQRLKASGKSGSIINIASLLGKRVLPGVAAYAASKAAVIQLTKAMALELAKNNIRVNAICPGYILTEINGDYFETDEGRTMIKSIPQRRLGKVSDLDGLLLLLASPASSFMTGTAIEIDGGHSLVTG
jgi:NAD(P)-dependent dehydrogenase (short-subunit alcohol dehydrogenase family)